jgi:hypothetical protein
MVLTNVIFECKNPWKASKRKLAQPWAFMAGTRDPSLGGSGPQQAGVWGRLWTRTWVGGEEGTIGS